MHRDIEVIVHRDIEVRAGHSAQGYRGEGRAYRGEGGTVHPSEVSPIKSGGVDLKQEFRILHTVFT